MAKVWERYDWIVNHLFQNLKGLPGIPILSGLVVSHKCFVHRHGVTFSYTDVYAFCFKTESLFSEIIVYVILGRTIVP